MDERQLLGLVGDIYELAAEPDRLSSLSGMVQRAMNVQSSIHFISEQKTGRMLHLLSASGNFDADARRDYRDYYHDRNVWFGRAFRHRLPYVARGEELVDERTFQRTEFCADWCSRVGIYHMIGCAYPVTNGVVGGSGIHKTKTQGPFSDSEKRLYGVVMTHVARMIQIAERIGTVRQVDSLTLDILDRLEVGVMLLRPDCSAVFINAVAADLVRRSRWLVVSMGKVRPIHQRSLASFARRVGVAAQTSAGSGIGNGGILRLRDPVGGDLPILIAPFRAAALGFGPGEPVAAVIFSTPDPTCPSREQAIREFYALSSAESRLVALLAAGRSLVDSAAHLGISPNTAKTQLRSIFHKTGFCRQADLISAVLANVVLKVARQPVHHEQSRSRPHGSRAP